MPCRYFANHTKRSWAVTRRASARLRSYGMLTQSGKHRMAPSPINSILVTGIDSELPNKSIKPNPNIISEMGEALLLTKDSTRCLLCSMRNHFQSESTTAPYVVTNFAGKRTRKRRTSGTIRLVKVMRSSRRRRKAKPHCYHRLWRSGGGSRRLMASSMRIIRPSCGVSTAEPRLSLIGTIGMFVHGLSRWATWGTGLRDQAVNFTVLL